MVISGDFNTARVEVTAIPVAKNVRYKARICHRTGTCDGFSSNVAGVSG